MKLVVVVVVALLAAACSTEKGAIDGSLLTDGAAIDGAATDGPGLDGTGSCAITVHPCCGGAAPLCIAQPDGGTCPPGTTFGSCSNGGQFGEGCYVQCVPPPPYCAPAGSTCQQECGGCGQQTATDWYCVCA